MTPNFQKLRSYDESCELQRHPSPCISLCRRDGKYRNKKTNSRGNHGKICIIAVSNIFQLVCGWPSSQGCLQFGCPTSFRSHSSLFTSVTCAKVLKTTAKDFLKARRKWGKPGPRWLNGSMEEWFNGSRSKPDKWTISKSREPNYGFFPVIIGWFCKFNSNFWMGCATVPAFHR